MFACSNVRVCNLNYSVPGSITAIPVEKISLNLEEGFLSSNPLVYYFGHSSPRSWFEKYILVYHIHYVFSSFYLLFIIYYYSFVALFFFRENISLYKHYLSLCASKVNSRLEKDMDGKTSGIIVNTCGWIGTTQHDTTLLFLFLLNWQMCIQPALAY